MSKATLDCDATVSSLDARAVATGSMRTTKQRRAVVCVNSVDGDDPLGLGHGDEANADRSPVR